MLQFRSVTITREVARRLREERRRANRLRRTSVWPSSGKSRRTKLAKATGKAESGSDASARARTESPARRESRYPEIPKNANSSLTRRWRTIG